MNRTWIAVLVVGLALGVAAAAVATVPEPGPEPAPELRFEEIGEEAGVEYEADDTAQFGNSRASFYATDYDGNGYPDLLAIGGGKPVLFENTGGEFGRSGALPAFDATIKTALFFDHDGDGREDLLLLPLDGAPVFLENRDGSFVRRDVGLGDVHLEVPTTASAADYDGDGRLDLLVVQNGDWRRNFPQKELTAARTDVRGTTPSDVVPESDNGNPNYLFRGTADGFVNVTAEAGLAGARWSTTASFADLTGDGRPDIHVANDFNRDYLYVNRGGTRFEADSIANTNRHGMASEVLDVDHDGRMDVFVTSIRFDEGGPYMDRTFVALDTIGNELLRNRGESFRTVEHRYNLSTGGFGWAAAAVDLDNDGDRDLLHATKTVRARSDRTRLRRMPPSLWRRHDTGGGFERVNASRAGFDPSDGRGLVTLDFDRDGDRDVAVASLEGSFRLYENRGAAGHWLQIAVAGDGDTPAVGARIDVTVPGGDGSYHLLNNARADLQSQAPRVAHLGLGDAGTVTVEVTWPDGTVRRYERIDVDRRVVVSPNGTLREASPPRATDAAG